MPLAPIEPQCCHVRFEWRVRTRKRACWALPVNGTHTTPPFERQKVASPWAWGRHLIQTCPTLPHGCPYPHPIHPHCLLPCFHMLPPPPPCFPCAAWVLPQGQLHASTGVAPCWAHARLQCYTGSQQPSPSYCHLPPHAGACHAVIKGPCMHIGPPPVSISAH